MVPIDSRGGSRDVKRTARLLGLIVVAALALGGVLGAAQATTFGHKYLRVNFCCNNEGLYGTKASMYTPVSAGDLTFPTKDCFAARSDAEIESPVVDIQTGWVRCATGANVEGTCSLTNNLVNYVETHPNGGIWTCYPMGSVGYNVETLYTVKQSGSTWYAWIAGVQDTHGVAMGGAEYLIEGAEWTGGCDNFNGYADYAMAITWQRWRPSQVWYQVQSSSTLLNCGWTASGGPPSSFSFDH